MILPGRFRGREGRLKALCRAFRDEGVRALHPVEAARITGLSVRDADAMLNRTPELFIRMPARPGAPRRFRLARQIAAMPPEDVTMFIMNRARGERMIVAGVALMVVSGVVLIVLSMLPWLWQPAR